MPNSQSAEEGLVGGDTGVTSDPNSQSAEEGLVGGDTSNTTEDTNTNTTDSENNLDNPTTDVNIDNYNFDGLNDYANKDSGVEIDGFLFFAEEIKGDDSYARREFKRTKIMSGGEFVTRGQYIPKSFSFTTTLDIDPNKPNMYDKIFQIMENKPCEIISPYMGDNFKAEVQITKTHPKASPSSLKLDIKVKEIVTPQTTVVGDEILTYPSTTTLSEKAINLKETIKKETGKNKTPKEEEAEQIKNDGKVDYNNPYGSEAGLTGG